MELTASLRKTIQGLGSAKNRRANGLFMAEGTKCVLETLPAFSLRYLFATREWLAENPAVKRFADRTIAVSRQDIERMSQLQSPQPVIAIYDIPENSINPEDITDGLSLALDCIQDPGNLGTIIRIADWFGIKTILASRDTADCFNPKVVQASMGAIGRVKIHYLDNLADELKRFASRIPVYGTFLDGTNIYSSKLSNRGIIVMGNEGNGISKDVSEAVTSRILIPPYPAGSETVESLNVAIATAITVAEFRRQSQL